MKPFTFAADIGSVKRGRFAWASSTRGSGRDMESLVEAVSASLARSRATTLGLECPLWVPIAEVPMDLTAARRGEGNRPWSAGAGCGALATGMVQTIWLLRALRRTGVKARIFLDWQAFERATGPRLLLWEAFVTGKAKRKDHVGDAQVAVAAFLDALPDPTKKTKLTPERPVLSLVGAALLRSGWSRDARLLDAPCLVLGPP